MMTLLKFGDRKNDCFKAPDDHIHSYAFEVVQLEKIVTLVRDDDEMEFFVGVPPTMMEATSISRYVYRPQKCDDLFDRLHLTL